MKIIASKNRLGRLLTFQIKPEMYILFETGQRGILFWVVTENNVRVIGYGRKPSFQKKMVFDKWENDHCYCG